MSSNPECMKFDKFSIIYYKYEERRTTICAIRQVMESLLNREILD